MSFDEFMKLLTRHYPKHHIAPGIQLAWLEDKAVFYGGVHIFPHGLQSRTVLVKCTAETSGECVSKLYQMWCDATGTKPTV